MEFAGPAPVGPFATLAAEMPLRKPKDVRQVEPGAGPGNTAPDTGQNRDNGPEAQAARDVAALRREAARRDLPAGPTPAFEVSQLEMDADLQQVIARVEAARSKARDASALKAEADAEARVAEVAYERAAEADRADPAGETASGRPETGTAPGEGPDVGPGMGADGAGAPVSGAPALNARF